MSVIDKHLHVSMRTFLIQLVLITVGTLIGTISIIVFFAPAKIAPAGVSGIGVILNEQFGIPIGAVILIGNIPILLLAYRVLGGLRAVIWTIYVVVLFSLSIDLLTPYFPAAGVSDDRLLNAIFAGVVSGVGGGFIYRGGGSYGGTSTLARILQVRYGLPLSSTYTYVSLSVVLLAGVFLGWESALYSLIALVIDGSTSDYMLEGPSVIRTVTIVTARPQEVSDVILHVLERGATGWEGTGMYTGETRHILFVTVARTQVTRLRQLVSSVDPDAFIVVGQGHTAYGSGFRRARPTLEDLT